MEEEDQQATDEESMITFIKSFNQVSAIKKFVKETLPTSLTIHPKFVELRVALASRQQVFAELPDLQSQVSLLREMVDSAGVFPPSWVTFGASATVLYVKTGRFVEGTETLFVNEGNLGQFVSIRAKYCIMALKDLVRVKALKCTADSEKAISEMALQLDGDVDEHGIGAALAAFDSATRQNPHASNR